MEDFDIVIGEIIEFIDDIAGDTRRFTQQQSVEIYREIESHCVQWIDVIRSEME